MEPLNDSFHLNGPMKTTGIGTQYTRQRISTSWLPRGFERWAYQKALLEEMNMLGGPDDHFGRSPEDYRPVTGCSETLDCACRRP